VLPTPRRARALTALAVGVAPLLGLGLAHGATHDGWRTTRGGPCTVRSHGEPLAADVLRTCRQAVPQVRAFRRTGWSGRVLVVVPRDAAELVALAPEAGDVTGVAAVATRDRVLVDPAGYRALSAVGRRVVLAHEVTHLALRAVTASSTPLWLVEGTAELVGLRGSGLRPAVAAQELAADVRRHRLPAALPPDSAFSGPGAPQAYGEAWLAVDLLSARYGDARLLAAYTRVGRGDSVAAVLRGLGTTPRAFTAAWRAHLVRELAA
jgi:hypothetical protein